MEIRRLELIEGAGKAEGFTVIIDVFRAFTLEAYLYSQGAEAIYAVKDVSQAFRLQKSHPDWLLVGERGGRKIDGFDYGNSPSSFEGRNLRSRTVIHTTSSGTQGIAGAVHADEVVTGSLVNARAVADYILKKQPEIVSLVAMGNSGIRTAEEDVLCAEYIESILKGKPIDIQPLADGLAQTAGKKFFDPAQAEIYPERDFALCTACDRFSFVLKAERIKDDCFRISRIVS